VDLELSEDQRELQQGVREFLEGTSTIATVRALQEEGSTGHSDDLWSKLAEGGWLGMALPEEYGGSGSSLFDLGLFYEEAGRVLLPTPFFSTIQTALLIEKLGTEEQKAEYLGKIAEGGMVGTVAFTELDVLHDPRYLHTTAKRDKGGAWIITGQKAFVQNASVANPFIVIARTATGGVDGVTAFLVPADADGVSVDYHKTFAKDNQGLVTFNDVKLDDTAVLGGDAGLDNAWPAYASMLEAATALQAMEMAGGAQKVLETTVNYVKDRVQFGVPIGSFQAVQHFAADMATQIDGAKLTAMQALWLISEGYPATREVSIAKSAANEAYVFVTTQAHQLHGGMGYVREVDLHLWSQRAKATELSLGNTDYHLERLATSIGL